MQTIEVVYSPLCEAAGAMIGQLRQWLAGTDVQISIFPFDRCPQRLKDKFKISENCFLDIFYCGNRIDSVPLHRDRICESLGIRQPDAREADKNGPSLDTAAGQPPVTRQQLIHAFQAGEISFRPIDSDHYRDEMSMCLCNYPFGNPPKQFHKECMAIKSQVFSEVWEFEDIAGIYAKYKGNVIGLLEVMPREILRRYGYMTGTTGEDRAYLSIGCYEIGYGIPRVEMIDLLMQKLTTVFPLFHRGQLEGVGIYGWTDGFNPYWVYQKYGFKETEKLSDNTVVMSKTIR